ncbi:MAG: transposase, partial [Isosphaerales bacterium]
MAHNPDLMLKIALYETRQGHLSPAQWARDVRDSDALRWLGQGIQPSRSALYNFRDRLSEPVFEMHAQAIRQAIADGHTAAENQERPKDKRLPRKKVKVSVTEPEAPLGRDKEKVFCPMYTAEFVVDTASLLILSFDVFAQVTDAGTLAPMLDRTQEVTGAMLI